VICSYEVEFRAKLGKSLYTKTALKAGHVIKENDLVIKAPGGGLPPAVLNSVIGGVLIKDVPEEHVLLKADIK
jgi:sialic acid synthase SpsE